MEQKYKQGLLNRWTRFAVMAACALVLAACGGGGGSPGATTGDVDGVTQQGSMTVTLTNQSGTAVNSVSAGNTITVTARALDSDGDPVANTTVTFQVDEVLLTASSATAITNSSGVAVITVTPASVGASGSTAISASATYSGITITGTANIQVGASTATIVPDHFDLVSYSPTDRSIVLKNTVAAGRTQTAEVKMKLLGEGNIAVPNRTVRFAFDPVDADFTFANGLKTHTGVTGQDGTVTALVSSGTTVSTVAVRFTLLDSNGNPDTTVNPATSDQISATNDVLSAAGISLSTTAFAFEGFDYAGNYVTITARLTDINGGQISNGTAVSFTTTGGAITGTNNSAMCYTVDGACSVKLVSQNPRPAGGIAVVTAMVNVPGSGIIGTSIPIVMSGSKEAEFSGDLTIDSKGKCYEQTAEIIVSDPRGNTMPPGSKLSVLYTDNTTASVVGDGLIKDTFTPDSGTTFYVKFTPGSTGVPCVGVAGTAITGNFTLLLTTPAKFDTTQVVTVTYYK